MPSPIEDYALIGDCQTAALVARGGSIDWLCVPRFDSGACFAALLGLPKNGRWLLAPKGEAKSRHRYRGETLILETEHETSDGVAVVTDFMPIRDTEPNLIRVVEGKRGRVEFHTELVIRFDYGSVMPWVQRTETGIRAVAGPNTLWVHSPVPLHGKRFTTVADFSVAAGERLTFAMVWHPSHQPPPVPIDPLQALDETEKWWSDWSKKNKYHGPWREAVQRSLITLKALTFAPTGGIVAAATTSLPEDLGGVRNWDYRYCWLRDATFTLLSLLSAGYDEEARAWREWLLRAVAGDPTKAQIMYGLAGERRLEEYEVPWLDGYEKSQPVRIGNAASRQFQLDVYGEVLDAMYQSRSVGLPEHAQMKNHRGMHEVFALAESLPKPGGIGNPDEAAKEGCGGEVPDEPPATSAEVGICRATWRLEQTLVCYLEEAWKEPDEGIWEVRGPRRHFTHSKVMAWVAFDRAIKMAKFFGSHARLERWRDIRRDIHEQVCREGFDWQLGSFVQSYGSKALDASLLMIPLVGFLPATDPRVRGTVAAIRKGLMKDGFVARYAIDANVDGLPGGEGTFLPCTFWFVDNLALMGELDEAREIFERLLALRNDVGLLTEEYDPRVRRLVGNFPQAFTHVGLVNSAVNLSRSKGPAEHRGTS
jgi:GH15 family glucan-1,4-alpha-glucosidase